MIVSSTAVASAVRVQYSSTPSTSSAPASTEPIVRVRINVESAGALYNAIARVARDPRNADDVACFEHLQSLLSDKTTAPTAVRMRSSYLATLSCTQRGVRFSVASASPPDPSPRLRRTM